MAAAVIAIRNARGRGHRNQGPSVEVAKKRQQAAQEQREFWARIEKENKLSAIVKKCDFCLCSFYVCCARCCRRADVCVGLYAFMNACIFCRYDKQGNGKLSKDELGTMFVHVCKNIHTLRPPMILYTCAAVFLQELAGGDAPTEEECSFVLNVADHSDKVLVVLYLSAGLKFCSKQSKTR